jgi:ribose 5-phosphate isomerase A
VEVVPFGLTSTQSLIARLVDDLGLDGEIKLRRGTDGKAFVTDNGNHILDCAFGSIDDPEALDDALKLVPGVVENGLFLGIADVGIIAGPMGVEVISGIEIDFEEDE